MSKFLSEFFKKEIKEFALARIPNESGGLIVNTSEQYLLINCENMSPTPEGHYLIDQVDITKAKQKGEIVAFWHSQPNDSAEPSEGDKLVAERYNIDAIIYSPKDDQFSFYQPIGYEAPYIGRTFYFGLQDCFQLVIDYYKRELNIEIPYPVDQIFLHIKPEEWESHPQNNPHNPFIKNYLEANGFYEVSGKPQKYDVMVFRLGKIVAPCHLGLYLGQDTMIHHSFEAESEYCLYDRFWTKRLKHIFRHKFLP